MIRWTTLIYLLFFTYISGETQQTRHSLSKDLEFSVTLDYKFLLHIPLNDELKVEGNLPLIVFLHGAGERGSDLELVKVHGPPKIVEGQPKFPFAVLSPQCKSGEMWDPASLDLLLDQILSEYPIDASRIYLTGLSMGGRGTWDWAMYAPQRFAAIAPICGWGERFMSHKIKDVPTWIFHGALDQVVPLKESIDMVNALRRNGNDQVKFTVYEEANHDSWTETYNNAKLYEWFLSHRKN